MEMYCKTEKLGNGTGWQHTLQVRGLRFIQYWSTCTQYVIDFCIFGVNSYYTERVWKWEEWHNIDTIARVLRLWSCGLELINIFIFFLFHDLFLSLIVFSCFVSLLLDFCPYLVMFMVPYHWNEDCVRFWIPKHRKTCVLVIADGNCSTSDNDHTRRSIDLSNQLLY